MAWAFRHAAAVAEVSETHTMSPPMNCDSRTVTLTARRWLRGAGPEGAFFAEETLNYCGHQHLGRAPLSSGAPRLVAVDEGGRVTAYEEADAESLARVQQWLQSPAAGSDEIARLAPSLATLPIEDEAGVQWARVEAEIHATAGGAPVVRLRPVRADLRGFDRYPMALVDTSEAPAYFELPGPGLHLVDAGRRYWVAVLLRDPSQGTARGPRTRGPTTEPWIALPDTLVPDDVGFALMALRRAAQRPAR